MPVCSAPGCPGYMNTHKGFRFHDTLMVTVLFSTAVKEMTTSDSVAPGTAVHVHVYSIIYMCILYSSTHTGQHDVSMYLLIQYMYMLLVLSNVRLIAISL